MDLQVKISGMISSRSRYRVWEGIYLWENQQKELRNKETDSDCRKRKKANTWLSALCTTRHATQNKKKPVKTSFLVLPAAGLEPARGCPQQILSFGDNPEPATL